MQKPTVNVPKKEWDYRGVKISYCKEYRRNHYKFKFNTVATESDLKVKINPPTITEYHGIKWVTQYYRRHGLLDGDCMKIDQMIQFNIQQIVNQK